GLVDPQAGVLAPVTGLVDGLTSPTGALAPVGGLVNGLIGDEGALTPVLGTVNGLLGGVTGGLLGGSGLLGSNGSSANGN
ncbi:hypothetical protein, partial [Nitrincola tapanii]|uniref:hypothetical protein n=1 Tax=Nitrincola tapanii TaxID=1708751 RepID=UPI00190FB3A3